MYEREGEEAARTLARAWQLKVKPGGLIPVIIELYFGLDPKSIDKATLEQLGGTIDAVLRSYLRVLVPFRSLRRIATHTDIRMVRAPTPAKVLGGLGSNLSESVDLTGAADL